MVLYENAEEGTFYKHNAYIYQTGVFLAQYVPFTTKKVS